MNAEEYRRAVDAVTFRPDFTRRTLSLLEAHRKETASMKRISFKTTLIAAALVAALAVTASAAFLLLSPSQVAQRAGNQALATAFETTPPSTSTRPRPWATIRSPSWACWAARL